MARGIDPKVNVSEIASFTGLFIANASYPAIPASKIGNDAIAPLLKNCFLISNNSFGSKADFTKSFVDLKILLIKLPFTPLSVIPFATWSRA